MVVLVSVPDWQLQRLAALLYMRVDWSEELVIAAVGQEHMNVVGLKMREAWVSLVVAVAVGH